MRTIMAFPDFWLPVSYRDLSLATLSNVLRRRPQSSCVCVHICLATWILALQWTHLLYCATLYFFSLSTQPQFSFSFTCKLLTICCAPFAKLVMHTGDKIHNQHFFWTLCVCDGHIYQTLLLLARYLQDMYITDYLQFSYSALYAAAASFWI